MRAHLQTRIAFSYSVIFLLNSFSISVCLLLISSISAFLVAASSASSVFAKFLIVSSISAVNISGFDVPSPSASLTLKLLSRRLIILAYPPHHTLFHFSSSHEQHHTKSKNLDKNQQDITVAVEVTQDALI